MCAPGLFLESLAEQSWKEAQKLRKRKTVQEGDVVHAITGSLVFRYPQARGIRPLVPHTRAQSCQPWPWAAMSMRMHTRTTSLSRVPEPRQARTWVTSPRVMLLRPDRYTQRGPVVHACGCPDVGMLALGRNSCAPPYRMGRGCSDTT